ncbi:MAG: hypothetical protein M1127_02015, partial [Patescibacteria group bacterium]|nr:hypothetical protein [Patescibacteria group bacterium]
MIKIFKQIIIVVIVAALVVTGLLASGEWNPSWNPFHPIAPMSVMTKSIEALSTAKSMKIDGKAGIILQMPQQEQGAQAGSWQDLLGGGGPGEIGLDLAFITLLDKTNANNPKSQTSFETSVDIGGVATSGKGQFISFGRNGYLKIDEVPELLAVFMPDLAKAQGQWLKINSGSFSSATSIDPESGLEQDEEFIAELKTLVQGRDILRIKKQLGRETVNQQQTTRYRVSLNKQEVKTVLPLFLQMVKKYALQEEQTQLADIDGTLNNFDQNF